METLSLSNTFATQMAAKKQSFGKVAILFLVQALVGLMRFFKQEITQLLSPTIIAAVPLDTEPINKTLPFLF